MTKQRHNPKIERWVLAPHAARRIQERAIGVDDLALVLTDPDRVIPQGPKYIFSKVLPGRDDNALAAVVLERGELKLWVVLTVMINFAEKA